MIYSIQATCCVWLWLSTYISDHISLVLGLQRTSYISATKCFQRRIIHYLGFSFVLYRKSKQQMIPNVIYHGQNFTTVFPVWNWIEISVSYIILNGQSAIKPHTHMRWPSHRGDREHHSLLRCAVIQFGVYTYMSQRGNNLTTTFTLKDGASRTQIIVRTCHQTTVITSQNWASS